MTDGNLRSLFQKHLPEIHWQSVETWSTGQGVPDCNGCYKGNEFWIENKLTSGYVINFEIGQVAWHERRNRAGGQTFIAVRKQTTAGPIRGEARDELWLFDGSQIRALMLNGLKSTKPIMFWEDGPANWHWVGIRKILAKRKIFGIPTIKVENHPILGTCRVKEHKLTAVNKIGRKLKPNEVIHHVNRNRKNNSSKNIEVLTKSKHDELHKNELVSALKKSRDMGRGPKNIYTKKIISAKAMGNKRWMLKKRPLDGT